MQDAVDDRSYDHPLWIGEDVNSRNIELELKTGSLRSLSSSASASTREGKRSRSSSSTSLTASMLTCSETDSYGSLEEVDEDEEHYALLSPYEGTLDRLPRAAEMDDGSSYGNLSTESPLSPFAATDPCIQGELYLSLEDEGLASLDSESEGTSSASVECNEDDDFLFVPNELLFVPLSTIVEEAEDEAEDENDTIHDFDEDEEVEI
eukprot:CAMPEP_0117051698 /NCGR_PEP_ID=MMETSP0472-20121206/35714_1 /TAXON_ID=693140 ORGANISM="Tiarina fusus, Strain LIS" /NCGR_SAMPLE_ID=MMETSP0472 /ASSEMBLY_ACC=CAM_ASM_000603 /LENGTH=206 /DNA_ID=CAMNT_0004765999 /DNA_START=60 /DNA_END=680 /DNA_ORIENTATION=-